MRGEFDDHLKWPFRGHVTVALLNQMEDNNHTAYTIGKMKADRQGDGESIRWGYHTFIGHADLTYTPAKNCQYLKYDCLQLQIEPVYTS